VCCSVLQYVAVCCSYLIPSTSSDGILPISSELIFCHQTYLIPSHSIHGISYDSFHWKHSPPQNHHNVKLRFLGINTDRTTFSMWICTVKYRDIWVWCFAGYRRVVLDIGAGYRRVRCAGYRRVVLDISCAGYRRVVLWYPAQHPNMFSGKCHSSAETCIRISWNQMPRFRLVPKCLEHPAGPGPKLIHSGAVWVMSHIGCESLVPRWGHTSHESAVMSHKSWVTGQSWATVGPCKWWEYDYNFLLHQILLEFISIWF